MIDLELVELELKQEALNAILNQEMARRNRENLAKWLCVVLGVTIVIVLACAWSGNW